MPAPSYRKGTVVGVREIYAILENLVSIYTIFIYAFLSVKYLNSSQLVGSSTDDVII